MVCSLLISAFELCGCVYNHVRCGRIENLVLLSSTVPPIKSFRFCFLFLLFSQNGSIALHDPQLWQRIDNDSKSSDFVRNDLVSIKNPFHFNIFELAFLPFLALQNVLIDELDQWI